MRNFTVDEIRLNKIWDVVTLNASTTQKRRSMSDIAVKLDIQLGLEVIDNSS